MTQAFNLSQFANKVNTSGQADLTTAVTGVLPTANGGTGLSSPGASGNVLRSNGSSWTSAALADYIGGRGQVFDTGAVFTASKATTVLTVTAVAKGTLYVGQTIQYGATAMTISSFGTGSGGTGTYNVSVSGTVSSRSWSGGNSGSWSVPTGITAVKVTVVGGGGFGGNTSGPNSYLGAGGGGGGSAVKFFTGLSGGSITYVLGQGGGTSSATYSGTTVSATGGSVGGSNGGFDNDAYGGAGGLGASGDLNTRGQQGGSITAPGSGYAGSNNGGSTILGAGPIATTYTTALNGTDALYGGAGGSGASGSAGAIKIGGAGAPGVVIIEW